MKLMDIEIDKSYLRAPLRRLLIVAVVSLGLLGAAIWLADAAKQASSAQQQKLAQLQQKNMVLANIQQIIGNFHTQYTTLQRQGVIGGESRLDWLEHTETQIARLRLPRAGISLQPQIRLPSPLPEIHHAELMATPMELTLGMYHEGDLFLLVQRLQAHAHPLLAMPACEMNRPERADASRIRQEGLIGARCTLHWLTIQNPSEQHTGQEDETW